MKKSKPPLGASIGIIRQRKEDKKAEVIDDLNRRIKEGGQTTPGEPIRSTQITALVEYLVDHNVIT